MGFGEQYLWWGIALLAIFLIGVTKSGFGSGVGLMIVPMMAIAMGHIPSRGAEAALGLLLPLLIIGDLIAIYQYRRLFSFKPVPIRELAAVANAPPQRPRSAEPTVLDYASPMPGTTVTTGLILKRLLPGTAIGVVLGGLLLWWFHQQKEIVGALMRIEIGIESILLVGLHWWRQYKGVQEHMVPEPARSHLTGGFAAVSSTLAHAAGPIIAMYLLPLRLERQLFVGTCAVYFFILNTAKLPAYYFANQFEHAQLSFTMLFLPLVLAGAIFGLWINKRMSDKLFTKIVYAITFLLGWYILIDGSVSVWQYWTRSAT